MKSFQASFLTIMHCLDLNYKRKTIKNSNIWRLNNTLLNNQQITEEMKKKQIKICIEMKTEQLLGFSKSSAKGKVHSNTSLPQETGEEANK